MHYKVHGANMALSMATLSYAINFSVWTLYAVLGLTLKKTLHLSLTELGLLYSAPALTGALSCMLAGSLADRYRPKTLLTLQMLITAPSLFILPYMTSLHSYMLLGLWIGLSGSAFTIGLRYFIEWFDRYSQGTTMGIFGAGDVGAAITLVCVPYIITILGWRSVGPVYGISLLSMAFIFWFFAPKGTFKSDVASRPSSLLPLLKNTQIWRFGLYYYFVFGSFIALIVWLPQYYVSAYGLSEKSGIAFTLAFVVTSGMIRALGGWFADRYGGRSVNWAVFWVCLVCLFFLSYPPTTMTIHGVQQDVNISIQVNLWVFNLLILTIGLAQGFGRASIFKTIHEHYPTKMGQIGGFVAGMGMLGGCTLPILFGLAVDLLGIYSACFMILYGVLAACMTAMFFANTSARFRDRLEEAKQHNFLDYD